MNASTEYYETLRSPVNYTCNPCIDMEKTQLLSISTPGLIALGDSETSSVTESEQSDCCLSHLLKLPHKPAKRRVSFSKVEIREYAVTVGDHPFCCDGLPLSLDWEHCEAPKYRNIEESRERESAYTPPPRLSYMERRDRLFTVSAANDDEIRNNEIDTVIKLLHHAWSQHHILPMPHIQDLEEEEEQEEGSSASSDEAVIHWRRVSRIRRSESFCE